MNEILIDVSQEYEGERIDKFLSILVESTSRNAIQKLIENEKDRKKGEKSLKRVLTFLWEGDIICKLTRAGHRREGTEP